MTQEMLPTLTLNESWERLVGTRSTESILWENVHAAARPQLLCRGCLGETSPSPKPQGPRPKHRLLTRLKILFGLRIEATQIQIRRT
jgi:hypothetical protein